jgi:hypothetical protein
LTGALQNFDNEKVMLGVTALREFMTLLYTGDAGVGSFRFLDTALTLNATVTDIALLYERMKDVRNYLEAGNQNRKIKDFLETMDDGVGHPAWNNFVEVEKVRVQVIAKLY